MSKRLDAYQRGVEQFQRYLEMFLHEGIFPTSEDIQSEWSSIDSLRSIPYSFIPPTNPLDPSSGYIVLFGEEYDRYDDQFPTSIRIFLLSSELDNSKDINQFITMQKIE